MPAISAMNDEHYTEHDFEPEPPAAPVHGVYGNSGIRTPTSTPDAPQRPQNAKQRHLAGDAPPAPRNLFRPYPSWLEFTDLFAYANSKKT